MAKCNVFDNWVGCQVGNQVSDAVDSGSVSLGEAMMASYDSITKAFLTSWLNVGLLVDLDAGSVSWLTAQLGVISVLLATVGMMVAAIWTMIHHRGEKAAKVAKSLFTVVLVSTAGVGLMQVVLAGGDAFADWIIESAGVTVDGRAQMPVAAIAAGSPGLAILAGIFGIIATIIQWGIMLVRSALLPLLVGVWPVTAAASMIGGAEQAFSKVTTWIIAFTIYKPIAAIIYAYAWKTKSGEDGLGGVINGLVLIVLAVVALPAIMRLIAPGTSAMGGSGGGGMALAGGAAVVGAGVAAGTAILSGGGSAAAGGAGKTAGTAKSTGGPKPPDTGGGGGPEKPGGTDPSKQLGGGDKPLELESGSGGGSGGTAGGTGSGGSGSGTVGGDDPAGGAGSETVGGDTAAGGTGSETVGGDTAAGGTGSETVGGDSAAGGGNAAQGTTEPASADSGASGAAESAGSSGSAGTAAGTGAPTGSPDTTPVQPNTNNGSSKAKDAGSAAAKSMGQAIADGTKDADGKDVIGE